MSVLHMILEKIIEKQFILDRFFKVYWRGPTSDESTNQLGYETYAFMNKKVPFDILHPTWLNSNYAPWYDPEELSADSHSSSAITEQTLQLILEKQPNCNVKGVFCFNSLHI
jgi:hypothetical protein